MSYAAEVMLLLICLILCPFHVSSELECGRTPIPPHEKNSEYQSVTIEIIGGTAARPYSWPWQAALEYDIYGTIIFGCSGTVIAEEWIMTAAHCVTGWVPSFARVGAFNISDSHDLEEQVLNVASAHVHPKRVVGRQNYDIALLRIDGRIEYNDHVQPICLPSALEGIVHEGERVYATGWGLTKYHPREEPDLLQQIALPFIATEECQKDYEDSTTHVDPETMICAGYKDHSVCDGDSGGPLVRKHNDTAQWYQIGIASWSAKPCAQDKKPGVFANVASMCDFIQNTTGAKLCKHP